MKNKEKSKKFQIIALIIFVLAMIGLTLLFLPIINDMRTEEGRLLISEKVNEFGIFAPLLYIFMHILNVVIAFIPGEPIEILGGILFGTFWGLILSLIGVFIGTMLAFMIVKRFGRPIVDTFVSQEKLSKYKILNNEEKLELFTFILFLVPGTPKDTLTYIVPLTKINPKKYFFLATIARIPSIVSSTFVGASLGKGRIGLSILIFAITAAIGIVGIFVNNKIHRSTDKDNKEKNKSDV